MELTSNPSANITIVSATDNHYIVLLAALIKSIELNHKTSEIIDYYVVGDKLSASNIQKLSRSVQSEKLILHWVDMKNVIPEGMKLPKDRSSYPSNIYMRLFIPFFLPSSVSKVLYLDVDMIALADISELWQTDLNGKIIGAVQDLIKTVGDPYGGIKNYRTLGLDKDEKYFNTGLLLIDREKWIEFNVTEKVLRLITENREFAKLPDQYGLNVALHKDWYEINPLWNNYSNVYNENPFLVHFFHRKPIYKSYDKNLIYKKWFFDFLNRTEWKEFRPISEFRRYWKKFKNKF